MDTLLPSEFENVFGYPTCCVCGAIIDEEEFDFAVDNGLDFICKKCLDETANGLPKV